MPEKTTKISKNDHEDDVTGVFIDQNNPSNVQIWESSNGSIRKTQAIVPTEVEEGEVLEQSNYLARSIFSADFEGFNEWFSVQSSITKNYETYQLSGVSSVKELVVDIHSSLAMDEAALHLLLKRVR